MPRSNTFILRLTADSCFKGGRVFLFSTIYTTFTDFSIKHLTTCNVYTNIGGIKYRDENSQPFSMVDSKMEKRRF